VIDLNALLRRPVEYYEYPWAIERHLLNAQARFRGLFQADDVGFIFAKPRSRMVWQAVASGSRRSSRTAAVTARARCSSPMRW